MPDWEKYGSGTFDWVRKNSITTHMDWDDPAGPTWKKYGNPVTRGFSAVGQKASEGVAFAGDTLIEGGQAVAKGGRRVGALMRGIAESKANPVGAPGLAPRRRERG